MVCPRCSTAIREADRYCSGCAAPLAPRLGSPEFESARRILVEGVRDEVANWVKRWLVIIPVIAFILGFMGFNEMMKNRVTEVVEKRLDDLKEDLKRSKSRLDESVIEANIAKRDLTKEQNLLGEQLKDLQVRKDELSQEIESLRVEKEKIAEILKETSFVVALHKLRHELYRIQDLQIRSSLFLNYEHVKGMVTFSHLITPMINFPDISDSLDRNVMQFNMNGLPTFIGYIENDGRDVNVSGTLGLYEFYVDRYIGQSIDKLNGMKWILITSPLYQFKPRSELEIFWSSIKKVRIQYHERLTRSQTLSAIHVSRYHP